MEKYYTYQELIEEVHKTGLKDLSEYTIWQKENPKAPLSIIQTYDEYEYDEVFPKELTLDSFRKLMKKKLLQKEFNMKRMWFIYHLITQKTL